MDGTQFTGLSDLPNLEAVFGGAYQDDSIVEGASSYQLVDLMDAYPSSPAAQGVMLGYDIESGAGSDMEQLTAGVSLPPIESSNALIDDNCYEV